MSHVSLQAFASSKRVRVLVISPIQVTCDALHAALARDKWVRVLEQPGSINGSVAICRKDPEVIVVCDGSSTDALRLLAAASRRLANCRLLVFGIESRKTFLRYCAGLRVYGMVSRKATLRQLVGAIRRVHDEGFYVSPALQAHASESSRRSPTRTLTDREKDIAALISRHLTTSRSQAACG